MWRPSASQVLRLAVVAMSSLLVHCAATKDDNTEYCEDETFRATCPEGEALVIESALYGRMREGRCVSRNYGHIGCAIDVKAHLDSWCSGRPSCELPVTALLRGATKPCPKDFRSFLEASYSCVKVMTVKPDECRSASFVEVTAAHGYISSMITETTGCGSIDTPWLLRARPGQRLNVTLWDFDSVHRKDSGPSAGHPGLPPPCHVYAIIKERRVTSSKTVCPDSSRTSHVFTSQGNTVEIRIVTKRQENDDHGYFMLQFEALGCPDLAPPNGGWVKRTGDSVLVGCEATDETWRLRCHKNSWIGSYANCSRVPASTRGSGKIWNAVSSSQGISIAIIIGVAVMVGILILVLGLLCLKWQRRVKRPSTMEPFSQTSCYTGEDSRSYAPTDAEKERGSLEVYNPGENNYYRTWQLQQRAGKQTTIQGSELPPPPYHPVSTSSDGRDSRYVEHVYESPKFDRRDMTGTSGSGEIAHAQYFELDPDAVVQQQSTLGRNIPLANPRDREITWSPRGDGDIEMPVGAH